MFGRVRHCPQDFPDGSSILPSGKASKLRSWAGNVSHCRYVYLQCSVLYQRGEPWPIYKNLAKDKHPPDIEYLDNYANKRWEAILNYMVERRQKDTEGVGQETKKVLKSGNLIRLEDLKDPKCVPDITADGFQFLLMDISSQVWYFLLKYLGTIEGKLDLADALIFIFQLSFLTLGKVSLTPSLNHF